MRRGQVGRPHRRFEIRKKGPRPSGHPAFKSQCGQLLAGTSRTTVPVGLVSNCTSPAPDSSCSTSFILVLDRPNAFAHARCPPIRTPRRSRMKDRRGTPEADCGWVSASCPAAGADAGGHPEIMAILAIGVGCPVLVCGGVPALWWPLDSAAPVPQGSYRRPDNGRRPAPISLILLKFRYWLRG
jgi:hypothetical protein